MDEMDYDMHIPPGAQPPSSMAEARPIPRCPYLLPNPSQTMTNSNLYDPLQFSPGRQPWSGFRQPLQNPYGNSSRYNPTPFYMMPQPQEQADRPQPDEFHRQSQSRAMTFGLQPPSLTPARPAIPDISPTRSSGLPGDAGSGRNAGESADNQIDWERRLGAQDVQSLLQTEFQSSPSPSHRSSSPGSSVSDRSQASDQTRSPGRSAATAQFASAANLDDPPVLSHTTLDRAFWDTSSQRAGRDNSRNSATGRLESAQSTSPSGSTVAVPTASAASLLERRSRTPPRHRRAGHGSSGGNARASDLDSDDDMDSISDEQQALHHFIDHLDGNMAATAPPNSVFPGSGIRARQVLRGAVANKRIASKSAIASLVCVEIESLSSTERTCIICYNDFGVPSPEGINEAPLQLPKCKHVFGDHCIKKWFEESDSCPYCRDKVPSEPVMQYTQSALQQFMRVQHLQASRRGVSMPMNPQSIIASSQAYARMLHDREAAMQDLISPGPGSSGQGRPFGLGDRRAPPEEFNEGQRRTRARHGTFRTSTARPFGMSDSPQSTAAAGPATGQTSSRPAPTQHQATPPIPPMPTMLRPPPQPLPQQPIQSMQIPHPLPAPTQQARERCLLPYQAHLNYTWQPQGYSHFGPPSQGTFHMPQVPHYMQNYATGNGSGPVPGVGNRMSFPSYPASMYGPGSGEANTSFGHSQAPTLPPPPGAGEGRPHLLSAIPPPPMPSLEPPHNLPLSPVSLPQHQSLPPISRLDMPNRLSGPAPLSNLQDSSFPNSTAGWGP
ncbi:zinc finger protein atl6 [Grosmannia clavigera kw1407]|uniref:Zinc finger protein atl6 n=1 Tax=Grosmannia clavigera (strain kw1407 / UAMH 11150) TaxID=655863 RepID=F0XE14_GROCL|nr:zinc finger protein atl6 [Grosmannia clavigera kw1407]EFX03421.1 zinc finger protein atl6 [Grosmannia clavigera kw1407]